MREQARNDSNINFKQLMRGERNIPCESVANEQYIAVDTGHLDV